MNLIYLSPGPLPNERADTIQIMKICNAFASRINLKLLYPSHKTTKTKRVENIWNYYGIDKNFEIIRLPSLYLSILSQIFPMLASFIQGFSYAISVFFFLLFQRVGNTTIYSCEDIFTASLLIFFKGVFKFRIFYEAHYYRRRTPLYLFKKMDGLVVITQKLKESYIQKGVPCEKISVVPCGVDLEKFDIKIEREEARRLLDIPSDIKIIGYLGTFRTFGEEKGIANLIEALDIIKQRWRNLSVYFVGGTREDAQEYIKREKLDSLEKQLNFIGYVPHKDVPIYLKAFDILVIPFSRTEYYTYYGSPHKLFEYMASKRPMVASDLPAIREILGEDGSKNAILVEPGNPKALAEGIEQVLRDKELAEKISTQAFEDVKNFTWDKRAERILSFINGKERG